LASADREGKWFGTATIAAKYILPNWAPPAGIRDEHPLLPDLIAALRIRMHNEDIVDAFACVRIGTEVLVQP